jgi:hypothetical protein
LLELAGVEGAAEPLAGGEQIGQIDSMDIGDLVQRTLEGEDAGTVVGGGA